MTLLRLLLDRCLAGLRVQVDVWGIVPTLVVWAIVIVLWAVAIAERGLWLLLVALPLCIAWLLAWAAIEGVDTDDGPTAALDEEWDREQVRRDLYALDHGRATTIPGASRHGIEL